MRSRLDLFRSFTLAGVLVLPGVASGQDGDGPPFRTSNDELNQELDRSLQQEFDDDHPAPEPPPPIGGGVPVPKVKDDRLRLRLGGYAAHFYTQLQDVKVLYREGTSGGLQVRIDEDQAVADFEPENAQLYRAYFDIGKHVSFEGGYWRAVYRSEGQANVETFTFGRTTFLAGENLSTSFEVQVADLDLVVKPVNNRWFMLGLHLGTRYVYWRSQIDSNDVVNRSEDSTLEAAMPVIGASIAFRPAKVFELFARARVGYLDYDRPESTRTDDDGDLETVDAKHKISKSAELDVGVRLILFDTIGVIAGYRIDYIRVEREVEERTEGIRGTAHGVYAGLILDF
jgi:hypothetical protein